MSDIGLSTHHSGSDMIQSLSRAKAKKTKKESEQRCTVNALLRL